MVTAKASGIFPSEEVRYKDRQADADAHRVR
jgi:hypothetical protein